MLLAIHDGRGSSKVLLNPEPDRTGGGADGVYLSVDLNAHHDILFKDGCPSASPVVDSGGWVHGKVGGKSPSRRSVKLLRGGDVDDVGLLVLCPDDGSTSVVSNVGRLEEISELPALTSTGSCFTTARWAGWRGGTLTGGNITVA